MTPGLLVALIILGLMIVVGCVVSRAIWEEEQDEE